ncbi:MAG: helix-turn-helix transcriptional regulator [Clostridia bacterium]|nr:helix-turn-helix transcriptional regulator [Clostridia bacterium]
MTEKIFKRIKELLLETDLPDQEICVASKIKLSLLSAIKQNKNLPSLKNIIILAEFFNCSVSYALGLSDFPDEFEKGLDVANIAFNISRFIKRHPPRFFYLKRCGFLKQFSSFKKWLNGSVCPNTYSFVALAKTFDILAEDLLRNQNNETHKFFNA